MIIGITASQPLPHKWPGVSPFTGRGIVSSNLNFALQNAVARLVGAGRAVTLGGIPNLQATATFVGSGHLAELASVDSPYYASAVHFPNTAWLQRHGALTGVGAFSKFMFSAWHKTTSQVNGFWGSTGPDFFEQGTTSVGPPEDYYNLTLSDTYTDTYPNLPAVEGTAWQHILMAMDITNAPSVLQQVYINGLDKTGTDDFGPGTDTSVAAVTDFFFSDDGFGDRVNGDYADVQFWFGTYLDFSVAANLELFIKNGIPVNPTIASQAIGSPAILFQGNTTNFIVNQGTAGSFTLHGVITNATSSPSPHLYSLEAVRAGAGNLSAAARLRMAVNRTLAGAGTLSVNGTIV